MKGVLKCCPFFERVKEGKCFIILMDFPYNSTLFGLVSYNDLCMQSFEGFSVRQFAVEASFIATKSPSIGEVPH